MRYSEIDAEQNLTVPGIIDYLQDCACFHDLDAGFGVDFWKERDAAWILTSWNIDIIKYPVYGQKIRIRTDCYKLRTFLGFRNFRIFDETGNVLVAADSRWALMNMVKGRPVAAAAIVGDAYGIGEALDVKWEGKHVRLPENAEKREPFPVGTEHLDTNHHVNNGQYVSMAYAYLPEDINVVKFWADYSAQARLGDMIYPEVAASQDGYYVALNNEAGDPYFTAKFYTEAIGTEGK